MNKSTGLFSEGRVTQLYPWIDVSGFCDILRFDDRSIKENKIVIYNFWNKLACTIIP